MEHWNGVSWKSITVPLTPNATSESLSKLAVISAANVWAIGNATSHSVLGGDPDGLLSYPANVADPGKLLRGVLDRWTGHGWRRVPLPRFAGIGQFTGIAAAGPGDVWIVGEWAANRRRGAHVLPLFLHWSGSTWTEQHPNLFPSSHYLALAGIEASSSSNVLATGTTLVVNDPNHPSSFSVSLQGGSWVVAPSPYLNALSGTWAVGRDQVLTQGTDQFDAIAAYQRSGSTWSEVPTPPLGLLTDESEYNLLGTDILDLGPSNAWLVGAQPDYNERVGIQQIADPVPAERWDGTSWVEVALPTTRQYSSPWLNAIDAVPGNGMVMMVGAILAPHKLDVSPLIYQGTCG